MRMVDPVLMERRVPKDLEDKLGKQGQQGIQDYLELQAHQAQRDLLVFQERLEIPEAVEPLVPKVIKVLKDQLVQLDDKGHGERLVRKVLKEMLEKQDSLELMADQASRVIWEQQELWDYLVILDQKEHQEILGHLDNLEEEETREHLVVLEKEDQKELRVLQEPREMLVA